MTGFTLAYIDPGSGSLLLQLLLGFGVGMGFFFRQNIARLMRLFKRSS